MDPINVHRKAFGALPDWVRVCWQMYQANPQQYPFGFAYHFPDAWNWKEEKNVRPS